LEKTGQNIKLNSGIQMLTVDANFLNTRAISEPYIKTMMRWAWDVARMGENCIQSFGKKTLKERYHLEDLSIDGTIILKWISKKLHGRMWSGFIWLRSDQWWALMNTVINVP
jgi:hypothetical protein